MSDKKNIDRVFQEKFKDFESTPSDAVWDTIHESLHGKKKKRRVVAIWWQLGGVAAALLLILTLAGVFNNDASNSINNIIVTSEKEQPASTPNPQEEAATTDQKNAIVSNSEDKSSDSKISINKELVSNSKTNNNRSEETTTIAENKRKAPIKEEQNSFANLKSLSKTKTENAIAKASQETKVNDDSNPESKTNLKPKSELDALIDDSKKSNSAVTETSSKAIDSSSTIKTNEKIDETLASKENDIEKAIAETNDNDTNEKEEEKFSRWSVAPNVAPVYFNTLGDGSSIHSQFNSNSKTGDINMSYGIAGSYAVNKRLKVRAGVNKVDLGYSTDNIIAYTTLPSETAIPSSFVQNNNVNQIDNISFRSENLSTSYLSAPIVSLDSAPEIVKTNNTSLDQQFGFIEVPLEIEYKLVDKKLDVNVIGGFSTMFLSGNEIYEVSDGNRTLIGEANNINNVSYSANFGIGLNYGVSEKININLEPMFKYQINTFNNTSGDFQPYFIGVYTGLSFKF